MHYSCRLFIGSSPASWSQYWENESDNNQIAKEKGHLFGLVNTTDSDTGRQIISDITNNYYSSDSKLPSIPKGVDTALALIKGDILYVISDNTKIIFKRGEKISFISSNSCGKLQDGDQFMMLTSRFLEKFPLDIIKKYLEQSSLQLIEESFLSDLNSFEDQTGVAAALIQVHIEESQDKNISIPTDDIIIEPQLPKKIRKNRLASLILLSVLLISLFVSIAYGAYINHNKSLEKQYQSLKASIEEKIQNAESLKNISLESSSLVAKEALVLVEQIKNKPQEVENFRNKIQKILLETGSNDSLDGKLFFDTQPILADNNFSKIMLFGSQLLLLDTNAGRIDSLGLPNKNKSMIIKSDEIKDAITFASDGNNLYFMTSKNIYLLSNNKVNSVADLSTLNPIDFEFYNGLLYLLDTKSIYKFTKSSSNFISPAIWLKDKQYFPDQPTSLAINGKVWVLNSNGKLTSYLRGIEEKFSTTSNENYLYANNLQTHLNTQELVFSDNNSVYVFQKDGKLLSKFSLKDKTVRDIAVDFTQKSLYILASDQKIYIISLP
jgi:hypothetical protein